MAETSTLQRASNLRIEEELASLLEGKDRPHNVEHMGWQDPTTHILLGSIENQTFPHPASSLNDFWSNRGTAKLPFATPRVPTHANSVGGIRHRILSVQSLLDHIPVEGPSHHLVWRRSRDPGLQGNRIAAMFALGTDETCDVLANILTDLEGTIARDWNALLQGLTEWQGGASGRRHLANKLRMSFEDSPLEDGMEHPAEVIIAEALRSAKAQRVLGWLKGLCTDASRPSFAASVFRCLGRQDGVGTASWRVELVRDGLAIDNVEIRDAAVQAAESWGDSDSLDTLKAHADPEPWLQQYIVDVIEDLTS